MFAERPARIEALDGFALGEWVVSHDRATQQDGSVTEGLSLYRVQGGRIVDDWYLARQARPSSGCVGCGTVGRVIYAGASRSSLR
jgi:hypothetical protein